MPLRNCSLTHCCVRLSFFPYRAKGLAWGSDLYCVEWDVTPQLNQSVCYRVTCHRADVTFPTCGCTLQSQKSQLESELADCKEQMSAGQRALQAAMDDASELRQPNHSAQDDIRRLQEESMYSQTHLSTRPLSSPVGCGAKPQLTRHTHTHTHLTTLFPGLPG